MATTQASAAQLLEKGEENNRWINEHMEELREEYGGEFIAVEDGDVIASDSDEAAVIKEVEEEAEDPESVIVTYIHEEGKIILR